MDKMERRHCIIADNVAHAAGASILSPVRHAVGLADYRWALPRISSVAIAMQPVHRLQIRPILHNYGASPTTPPSYIRVRAIVQACGRRQSHTETHRRTDRRTWPQYISHRLWLTRGWAWSTHT